MLFKGGHEENFGFEFSASEIMRTAVDTLVIDCEVKGDGMKNFAVWYPFTNSFLARLYRFGALL